MKIVEPDWQRHTRCGIPEVIYGQGKSCEDIEDIVEKFLENAGRAIVTKISDEDARYVVESIKGDHKTDHNRRAQTLVIKDGDFEVEPTATVGIISAGTSDIPIAEEAKVIAEELGVKTRTSYDVGVAGLHRLEPALTHMKDASALIVVAGMEGALPSVVAGLVDVPVVGVPTSVGYGTGKGGVAALHTMLNSCTPVAVVNIDNGYGAAVLAYQITKKDGNGKGCDKAP